eukprot:403343257
MENNSTKEQQVTITTRTRQERRKHRRPNGENNQERNVDSTYENKNFCLPTQFKKAIIKEGYAFRRYITIFMFLHVIFFALALAYLRLTLMVFEVFFAYLCYYTSMTLSRLSATLYLTCLLFGSIYGIYDMFDQQKYYGAFSSMFMYLIVIVIQGYGFLLIGRAMINYTHALNRPAQREPLIMERNGQDAEFKIKTKDNDSEYEYYSEYDDEDEEAGKKKTNGNQQPIVIQEHIPMGEKADDQVQFKQQIIVV